MPGIFALFDFQTDFLHRLTLVCMIDRSSCRKYITFTIKSFLAKNQFNLN